MRAITRPRRLAVAVTLCLVPAAFACGGSDQAAPVPSSMAVVSGDGQTATVGSALSERITVEVLDDQGAPVSGFTVSWSVTAGGGSVASASSTTGSDGRAGTTWTLGGTAGTQTASASGGSGLSATFNATAEAGPPAQVAVSGTTTLDALQATTQLSGEVQDAFGNPLPGDVTWATSDESVATVDETGTVTAQANGNADITATSGDVTGSASVTVAQQAASIAVTPANPVTTVDGTVQLAATGKDANDFDVADVSVTWASGDESVATVDDTGLVTGVAEGQADITATSGEVSGSVTLTVTAAPFEPTGDMDIDGDVTAQSITVPAGVTLTLTAGATLTSATTLEVAGTITGACVDAALVAGTDLTVSGTVSNDCDETEPAPPGLTLTAGGAVTLQDAVLSTSGPLTVDNTGGASGVSGPLAVAGPMKAEAGKDCLISGALTKIELSGLDGSEGDPKGTDGLDAPKTIVQCGGNAIIEGSTFNGIRGGKGGMGSTFSTEKAVGGNGGAGGSVTIIVAGDILFRTVLRNGILARTYIGLPGGGSGGQGNSRGSTGAASALGGQGGHSGIPRITAGGTITIQSPGALELTATSAGQGGGAVAIAGNGEDATSSSPAEPGYPAEARGGTGGAFGYPDKTTNLIGDIMVGEVVNPSNIDVSALDTMRAGAGGGTLVGGGNGGAGSAAFKDGADAGTSTGVGGDAGPLTIVDNRGSGQFLGMGAEGGFVGFGLTKEVYPELLTGSGGAGWSDCRVGNVEPGGMGGLGSIAAGALGQPSPKGSAREGGEASFLIFHWGNGGDGGDGVDPGTGGAPADISAFISSSAPEVQQPSLQPGANGSSCATDMAADVVVESDKNGHDPYTQYSTVSRLTATLGPDGQIQISGSGPWVTLTGTVSPDGSFDVSGTGTVAGYPGVTITMSGQLTMDSDGRITGISASTLVLDAANNVFPPNGQGVRNSPVYSVTATTNP